MIFADLPITYPFFIQTSYILINIGINYFVLLEISSFPKSIPRLMPLPEPFSASEISPFVYTEA
jgi:hypothetical protein